MAKIGTKPQAKKIQLLELFVQYHDNHGKQCYYLYHGNASMCLEM
jgi:hypothetical protein